MCVHVLVRKPQLRVWQEPVDAAGMHECASAAGSLVKHHPPPKHTNRKMRFVPAAPALFFY